MTLSQILACGLLGALGGQVMRDAAALLNGLRWKRGGNATPPGPNALPPHSTQGSPYRSATELPPEIVSISLERDTPESIQKKIRDAYVAGQARERADLLALATACCAAGSGSAGIAILHAIEERGIR